jgi:hypothetical protein
MIITPTEKFVEKHFVTYEIAKAFQELGFDEHCIAWTTDLYKDIILINRAKKGVEINLPTSPISVPIFEQAFEWLRSKGIFIVLEPESEYEITGGQFSNWDTKHNNIDHKIVGCYWSIYPHFFTENDGFDYKEANSYEQARLDAIFKAIELLKQK